MLNDKEDRFLTIRIQKDLYEYLCLYSVRKDVGKGDVIGESARKSLIRLKTHHPVDKLCQHIATTLKSIWKTDRKKKTFAIFRDEWKDYFTRKGLTNDMINSIFSKMTNNEETTRKKPD